MINVAILGNGVVGSGTAKILLAKENELKNKTGEIINLKYVLVRHDYEGCSYTDRFVYDFETILNDSEISIVVEVMGGTDPAYDYVKKSLLAGKNVVTSNKQLIAEYGDELMKIASEKNINILFEGAVAGAIPIIHSIRNCLEANEIKKMYGIINGTTNYILTKMIREGQSYNEALKKAQELGYAEADPTRDVDGIDACRKLCILADIIYGKHIHPDKVHTEGIRKIDIKDVNILGENNMCVKLLGYAEKNSSGKTVVLTEPFAVGKEGILYATNDSFNAVQVETDNAGMMAFYGRGAGDTQTGSAVVNDIVEIVKADNTIYSPWSAADDADLEDYNNFMFRHYVRTRADKGIIKKVFPNCIILKASDEISFITDVISEKELSQKLEGFDVKSILKVL